MDKTIALWRLRVSTLSCCFISYSLPLLLPDQWQEHILCFLHWTSLLNMPAQSYGRLDSVCFNPLLAVQAPSKTADICSPAAKAKELVRLSPTGAPIFSLAKDGSAPGQTHRSCQVFCGNADKKIVAWEPPDNAIQEKVRGLLDGSLGGVDSF